MKKVVSLFDNTLILKDAMLIRRKASDTQYNMLVFVKGPNVDIVLEKLCSLDTCDGRPCRNPRSMESDNNPNNPLIALLLSLKYMR